MKQGIVLLGVVCASFSALLVRCSTAPSLVLVAYRMAITILLMLPVALLRGRGEFRLLSGKWLALSSLSGAALGLHLATYYEAVHMTSIASANVLCATELFFVAFGSVVLLRQRISRWGWVAILIAFAGSVTIALSDAGGGGDALLGDAMALLCAFFMSIYTMLGAYCRRRLTTLVYTFVVYAAAGLTALALVLAQGVPLTGYAGADWLAALGQAVLCTLLGHSLFSWGLKFLPASLISMMKLLEAPIAAVLGFFLFGEAPVLGVLLGGAVVLLGLWLYLHAQSHTGLSAKVEAVPPKKEAAPADSRK